jgi:hypothetical protein
MAYSPFENEYKVVINNILKEIYGNTEYWGRGPSGNYGIIKSLTPNDDPNWSNYNFINTHWTVRDKVILPYLKNKYGSNITYNKNFSQKDSTENRVFLQKMVEDMFEIFGSDSPLRTSIVDAINKTRSSGTKRENSVKSAIESLPGIIKVDMVAEAGGTLDFMGVDMKIFSNGSILPSKSSGLTAQVKPFIGLEKEGDDYVIMTDALRRKYDTDLMVFGKNRGMEYHVAIFKNQPEFFNFTENTVTIPKELMLTLINFNFVTNKSVYKI